MSIAQARQYQGKDARAWYDAGEAALEKRDLAAALDAYRISLKLNPRAGAAWVGLAKVMEANQQFSDALECLKRGAQAEPGNPTILSKLAAAHMGQGDVTAARAIYERAISQQPKSVSAHFGMGQLLEDLGDADAAAKSYRRVMEIDPGNAMALSNLLGLGRSVDITEETSKAQADLPHASDTNAALIGYGLGKALEQTKDYDAAFAAFHAANEARKRDTGTFERGFFDARIDAFIETLPSSFFAEREGWGDASQRPVFIVGLPRSGTTLTEQILSAHPACFGAGEMNVLTDLTTGTPDRLNDPQASWPTCAGRLTDPQLQDIGRSYQEQAHARAPQSARRVIDKQPLNFWHLGMVALALPNAHIIHCTRDIRDTGLSIYCQNFNPDQRWATDLSDIAYYWQGYQRLMEHWREVSGLKILEIAYEETVRDIETQAQKLLAFLELDWDPAVLSFHEQDRAVQTPSRWQVRQPLYTGSRGKWQRYEKHLEPLMTAARTA
ncbi:MAG: sulfotransferase [Sphingomonadales bacterium]